MLISDQKVTTLFLAEQSSKKFERPNKGIVWPKNSQNSDLSNAPTKTCLF